MGGAAPPPLSGKGHAVITPQINVLIVDDSVFVRNVLGKLLEAQPRIQHVFRARNAAEALLLFESRHPDVVVLDLELPDEHGLSVLKSIKQSRPSSVVIILSSLELGEECFRAGADWFLPKEEGLASVPQTIEALCRAGHIPTNARSRSTKPTNKPEAE
jgi:DNA-binding NarL/FixJ family response regulator